MFTGGRSKVVEQNETAYLTSLKWASMSDPRGGFPAAYIKLRRRGPVRSLDDVGRHAAINNEPDLTSGYAERLDFTNEGQDPSAVFNHAVLDLDENRNPSSREWVVCATTAMKQEAALCRRAFEAKKGDLLSSVQWVQEQARLHAQSKSTAGSTIRFLKMMDMTLTEDLRSQKFEGNVIEQKNALETLAYTRSLLLAEQHLDTLNKVKVAPHIDRDAYGIPTPPLAETAFPAVKMDADATKNKNDASVYVSSSYNLSKEPFEELKRLEASKQAQIDEAINKQEELNKAMLKGAFNRQPRLEPHNDGWGQGGFWRRLIGFPAQALGISNTFALGAVDQRSALEGNELFGGVRGVRFQSENGSVQAEFDVSADAVINGNASAILDLTHAMQVYYQYQLSTKGDSPANPLKFGKLTPKELEPASAIQFSALCAEAHRLGQPIYVQRGSEVYKIPSNALYLSEGEMDQIKADPSNPNSKSLGDLHRQVIMDGQRPLKAGGKAFIQNMQNKKVSQGQGWFSYKPAHQVHAENEKNFTRQKELRNDIADLDKQLADPRMADPRNLTIKTRIENQKADLEKELKALGNPNKPSTVLNLFTQAMVGAHGLKDENGEPGARVTQRPWAGFLRFKAGHSPTEIEENKYKRLPQQTIENQKQMDGVTSPGFFRRLGNFLHVTKPDAPDPKHLSTEMMKTLAHAEDPLQLAADELARKEAGEEPTENPNSDIIIDDSGTDDNPDIDIDDSGIPLPRTATVRKGTSGGPPLTRSPSNTTLGGSAASNLRPAPHRPRRPSKGSL